MSDERWSTWDEVESDLDFDPRKTDEYTKAQLAEALGGIVYCIRTSAGLSQDALAKAIDTSQPGVARLERGANLPTVETLARVAAATDRTLVVGLLPESVVKEHLVDFARRGEAVTVPPMIEPWEAIASRPENRETGLLSRLYGTREVTDVTDVTDEITDSI